MTTVYDGKTLKNYVGDELQGEGEVHLIPQRPGHFSVGVRINLKDYYYGWRDAAIVVLFVVSSYGMVYLLMKLRTKRSKTAE